MRRLAVMTALLLAAALTAVSAVPLQYPRAAKSDVVDTYHGTPVPDPYRWLENPDSPETRAWIKAENQLTFGFLDKIPQREAIRERLTRLWNYERYGIPFTEGGRYFFTRNDGLQNQAVMWTAASLAAKPTVLLDPNKLSTDGTVSVNEYQPSHDGKRMVVGISTSGSDWTEYRVLEVPSGRFLDDRIQWAKFSDVSWTRDNKGFFYSRYDEPNEATRLEDANYYQKLYYHTVGTPQSQDVLVFERRDEKEWGFTGEVSDDGRFLIISVSRGTEDKNLVFIQDLQPGVREKGAVEEVVDQFKAAFYYVGNQGDRLWFQTTLDAPRGRIVSIDLGKRGSPFVQVVPQQRETLQSTHLVGGRLIVEYLKDARTAVRVFALDGKPVREVALPGLGTADGFSGHPEKSETFYAYTSFTTPTAIYRYDVATGKSTLFRKPKVAFDPSRYETKQVFYKSKDGTRVPMFITHRRGLRLDGGNPTLLYGYGGFNVAIQPTFSVSRLVWMEMGGVYAVANLRGGGEYGEDWHQAGMKLNKQNVFDDFIAAAQWLIASRYTKPSKIAIAGGSNGGLLVGACITQRPDLFGAALPAVGVMDMLRFQKFTIGWAWTSDYGSSEDPSEFQALYAYSPLHNIRPGVKYPATLITTADHDDRVVPAHSFKFAAALQAAQAGPAPILIRIETKAGHGAGKPTSKIIEEAADQYAFLVKVLGM